MIASSSELSSYTHATFIRERLIFSARYNVMEIPAPDKRSGNVISERRMKRKRETEEHAEVRGEASERATEQKARAEERERGRARAKLGTVICKEAGVCFGRWQQSAAVRDNPPVIKTINPSAD